MGFKNNAIATIWKVDKNKNTLINFFEGKKYADIQISTSRKGLDGKYENDFTGVVRCFGKAFDLLNKVELQEKDKIKLLEVETSAKYNKQSKKTFVSYTCWNMELPEGSTAGAKKPTVVEPETNIFDGNDGDDDFPF